MAVKLIFTLFYITLIEAYIGYKSLTDEELSRLESWNETHDQNIWELSGQFEGDIILNIDRRNGIIKKRLLWKNNEMPYVLDNTYTEEEKKWIVKNIQVFNDETCLLIRPKKESDKDYVYVSTEGKGCWSSVGRTGGRQIINIQTNTIGNGCMKSGSIQHEFLHSFGFYHMQSATNSDDYVTIVMENVLPNYKNNFQKYDETVVTDFGVPYDYDSVLHYSAYAFTKNDKPTIVTKKKNASIGQRKRISKCDLLKLRKMYKCDCLEN